MKRFHVLAQKYGKAPPTQTSLLLFINEKWMIFRQWPHIGMWGVYIKMPRKTRVRIRTFDVVSINHVDDHEQSRGVFQHPCIHRFSIPFNSMLPMEMTLILGAEADETALCFAAEASK